MRSPKVLIRNAPARGIDPGATNALCAIMNGLAVQGRGVVMIVSEMSDASGHM